MNFFKLDFWGKSGKELAIGFGAEELNAFSIFEYAGNVRAEIFVCKELFPEISVYHTVEEDTSFK